MESVNNSEVTLRRHGSSVSLQSSTLSTTSSSSLKRANRSLREKFNEIETFKDILFGQIETLQRYFDACADINLKDDNCKPFDMGVDGKRPIDFKGEAITFRETTSGVLITLQHCLDIITQRDECWKRRLERETDKRKKTEDLYRQCREELMKARNSSLPGPDLEVSQIKKSEFFLLEYMKNYQ